MTLGNLWFTEQMNGGLGMNSKIGRITPAGTVTEFPLPTFGQAPLGITAAPDGNLWFTEYLDNLIGRITPAGNITEFPVPSYPLDITAGADGNLWFTEPIGPKIGRITPAGAVTEFPLPTANSGPNVSPSSITVGPDGNLWFVEDNQIGCITP